MADLRDYFAAKALQALITKYGNEDASWRECAEYSYSIADAMLAERSKP